MSTARTRLPLAPLARAHGITIHPRGITCILDPNMHAGLQRIANLFAVDRRSIERWHTHGIPLTPRRVAQIEDICDNIRHPPALVWGHAWYVATSEFIDGEDDSWYSDDPSLDELAADTTWPECRSEAA